MKCPICNLEFDEEELVNWSQIDSYEVYGQETACPECGTPVWIPSWKIEEMLEE